MVTATKSLLNYASASAVRIGVSSSREAPENVGWIFWPVSNICDKRNAWNMDGNVWNMDGHVLKKWIDISSHAFKFSWSIFQLCLMRTKKYHFIGMKENMLLHFNVVHVLKPESSVHSVGFVFSQEVTPSTKFIGKLGRWNGGKPLLH